MCDREFLKSAWALVSSPTMHSHYTEAVFTLLSDGRGGFCPRALQMFELAVEVSGMRDGSLQALMTAWTTSQFLAPITTSADIVRETIPSVSASPECVASRYSVPLGKDVVNA